MAAKAGKVRNDNRKCGKASKKRPKMFDAQKRRLVTVA
jgi:ribosomal protein S30